MIIKKFQEQVNASPNNLAVKTEDRSITYKELNIYAGRVADAIAGGDKSRATDTSSQRVSLLFEHGVDMIIGVIGALKAGKTYVPLDIAYPEKRLAYMLEDSESGLILTDSENFPLAEKLTKQIGGKVSILNIDNINTGAEGESRHPGPGVTGEEAEEGDRPAYILYTSGSTGRPKGVVQTHRNIVYFIENWIRYFSITGDDRVTLLSAFSHDAAVMDIFGALLAGACLYPYYLKTGAAFNVLYTLLKQEKITIWHSVPSFFRFFANTMTAKDYFEDIRWVLLGGESLRAHDLELFKNYFPKATLGNIYGQTESSFNSLCTVSREDTFDNVSIGEPLEETEILLVDKKGNVVETMGVGEIVVASDYVTPGYWKDREKSEAVFIRDDELGRLYLTGDLGRLTAEGTIKMMGRKDFQIKIRGFRVESGEIETVLLRHPAVKEAVIIAKEEEHGDNYLCAYIVSGETIPAAQLRDYLFTELPDYMVPRYFIPLEKMPVTPNGKIDRNRLPEPDEVITPELEYAAPTNETERKVAAIWQEVLELDKVGLDDNFIELGGHSLLIVSIISKIHQAFNVELQLRDVFDNPTVRELSRLIVSSSETVYSSIEPAEEKEYYPVTSDQMRMFILSRFEGINTAYNLPSVINLKGKFDRMRFEQVFQRIVKRHEAFRTSFEMKADKVVQLIHRNVDFRVSYIEAGALGQTGESDVKRFIRDFIRPFDLSKAPLLRVTLLKISEEKHFLLWDVPHIISDGISVGVLWEEFSRLYAGEELSGLRLAYRDYAEWQDRLLRSGLLDQQEKYWLNIFKDEIPVLNLPTNYPRPAIQAFEGEVLVFYLEEETTQRLNRLVKETGTTLFMVLLAMYNILLHKYSGQEDIVIGSIISGRNHIDLENIVGMFVETLPLRNFPAADKSFDIFLEEVKENTLSAFGNQQYPFGRLVEILDFKKDRSRNPLFDAAFILQNTDLTFSRKAGPDIDLKVSHHGHGNKVSKFDLNFEAFESAGRIICCFQYCTKLFKRQSMQLMAERFSVLIESILNNRQAEIRDLDYTIPVEKEMINVQKVQEIEFDF